MSTSVLTPQTVHRPINRKLDRIFFSAMSLLLLATVLIGFWPSYFSHGIVRAPLPSPLVHIHGAIFSAWIILLLVQVGLVVGGKIRLHRTLGLFGFGLAVLMLIVGTLTATASLQRGIDAHSKFALQSYILPMGDLFLFGPLVFFTWRTRRRPEAHKRLAVISTIALMGAPLSRFPFAVMHVQVFAQSVVMLGFLLLIVTYDLFTLHRIQAATAWGLGYTVFIHAIRFPIAFTPAWAWFARHMAGRA